MSGNHPCIFGLFLTFMLMVAAGCGSKKNSEGLALAPTGSSAPVSIIRPEFKSLRRVLEQPGYIEATEETLLRARIPGYTARVLVDIGQRVRGPRLDAQGKEIEPGEILAELAVPEMVEEASEKQAMIRQAEAEVIQARKALAAAQANVLSLEASVAEARAGVKRAQALYDRWESEAKRVGGLARSGVLDAQTAEETLNQFRAATATRDEVLARVALAEAAVNKARADQDKARADVLTADARVEVTRAEARRLTAMLAFAQIRAPFDGMITQRHLSTGDFLQPSENAKGIFALARIDPVRVVIAVPEVDAALVQEKATVNLTIQAVRNLKRTGTVTRTSWALDPRSRTLRTEIDLPNADALLRPGMYVYARIDTELPRSWVLPAGAIVKQGDTMVGFQIVADKAVRTPVQLGRTDGNFTEILRLEKPGNPPLWVELTGEERFANKAAGLVDGQELVLDIQK